MLICGSYKTSTEGLRVAKARVRSRSRWISLSSLFSHQSSMSSPRLSVKPLLMQTKRASAGSHQAAGDVGRRASNLHKAVCEQEYCNNCNRMRPLGNKCTKRVGGGMKAFGRFKKKVE